MRKFLFKNAADYSFSRNFRLHYSACKLLIVGIALCESGQQEIFLGGEVAKQRSMGHVRPGSNVPQGGALVAMLGEAR